MNVIRFKDFLPDADCPGSIETRLNTHAYHRVFGPGGLMIGKKIDLFQISGIF
jgi:hypothetical protein